MRPSGCLSYSSPVQETSMFPESTYRLPPLPQTQVLPDPKVLGKGPLYQETYTILFTSTVTKGR